MYVKTVTLLLPTKLIIFFELMRSICNFVHMKLSRTKYALYGNLQSVKMRRRHGLFTAEGLKSVSDISRHFRLEALVLGPDSDVAPELRAEAPNIYEATTSEMKGMSGFTTPSSVMGVFRIPDAEEPEVDTNKLYLMLDGVRDPGNLGTIIRTCHWFGIYDVFASYDTVDCYNPKVVQATMGSLGAVRVHYCDLEELIRQHRQMPVYGTLLHGRDIFKAPLTANGFVVMGNEGVGISPAIRDMITVGLNIPPANSNHGESLNVSIATAIVLAQFQQRLV